MKRGALISWETFTGAWCTAPVAQTHANPTVAPIACPTTTFHGRATEACGECAWIAIVGPRLGKSHGMPASHASAPMVAMTMPARTGPGTRLMNRTGRGESARGGALSAAAW